MANYSAIKAAVNAYIKRNGRKEITGLILNSVLNAVIDSLGRYFQFAGGALPTDDPGTPDQNVCYLATEPGVYTNFGGITIGNEEVALLFWDGEWTKKTIALGIQEVNASVDNQVGTPSVDVSYSQGRLVLTFHNLKGEQGIQGEQGVQGVQGVPGASAGFGRISAEITGGVGTPVVSVETSGDNTAKNIDFRFVNLKGDPGEPGIQGEQGIQGEPGDPGVTSVSASVDNNSGVPSVDVTLNNGVLTLAFHNLKGLQGNPGSSVDYPFTLVNNVSDGGVTAALTAEMGKYLYDYINGASSELSIILTDYTPYDYVISNQNVWATQGTETYQGQCILVPLGGIRKIKCSTEGGNGIIAFLKNSTMVGGETPAFSDSYPTRISVVNGDPAIEYVIPGDAHYLYVNTRQANGTDLIPRYTIKQLEQSSGAIFFDKIADNLTTDNALRVLSAKQGVVLKGMIGAVDGKVDGLLPRVGGSLAGKKVSIIGDSISCFGTEAEVRNGQYTTPYFKILSTDVGQTIQSWVTWLDVYQAINNTTPTGKTIGGVALTPAMIGTKQTFTPVAEDVGKCIGVPRWAGAYTAKPWWQVLIEQTGMVFCGNASWSGGRVVPIPEGEERHDSFVLSEMYSEYTLGRVKGRADDGTEIIPDVILLYRGTNDFSSQDALGVEGLETPDMKTFTEITDAHNFTQGYIWSILKLRELYPQAVIILCTLNVFKRVNYSHFPANNGTYTLPDYNNKIREIADLMGCGVIELDRDGITFENCYPTYINDSSTEPTHPNTTGHLVMGKKAADDVRYYLP